MSVLNLLFKHTFRSTSSISYIKVLFLKSGPEALYFPAEKVNLSFKFNYFYHKQKRKTN